MIDAHIKLGKDYISDGKDTTESEILKEMEKLHLDGCVVYPAGSNISLEIERENNERVLKFGQENPNKIFPVCQLNPNYEYDLFFSEFADYKKKGCKGISIDTEVYGWDAHSHHGRVVFETASNLDLPLFITSGVGLPLGQPIRLYDLCREYQNVKVVLVYATKSYVGDQCKVLADECSNIYFETSLGPNIRSLKNIVKKYGANRVAMGSGLIELMGHSVYSFENSGLSQTEIQQSTSKTILEIMGIEEVQVC